MGMNPVNDPNRIAPSVPAPIPSTAPGASGPAAPSAVGPAPTPFRPVSSIKSPTPGTFYNREKPDAKPFVEVGTRVSPSSVVGLIEAMKIFNEIQAECSGVIVRALVDNGQAVEYGTVLFEVDPTG